MNTMPFEYLKYKGINYFPMVYTEESLRFMENDFEVFEDDVFLVSYPKSGTVWMMEILSLIRSNGDPTWCQTVPNWDRVPWFGSVKGLKIANNNQSPRLLCSHEPVSLFPKAAFNSKAKIIYIYRNPKDVLVSSYYYANILSVYKTPESFEQFFDTFLEGDVPYGSWFDHIKGWMEMKDNDRCFFITYEDLLKDLRGSVQRICAFLEKELNEKAIDSVVENASFKTLKANKMANFTLLPQDFLDNVSGSFMRKGISGDWKNHFTYAQNKHFNQLYQKEMKHLKVKLFWD